MMKTKRLKRPKKSHPDSKRSGRQDGITPPCLHFKKCGGCQYQNKTYQDSLLGKEARLKQLLGKFGTIQPILGMEHPWSYRNKCHSTFVHDKRSGVQNGLYAKYSHKLIPIDRCLIQDERADAIIQTIASMMKSFKLTAYNEQTGKGFLRHVLVKIGFSSNQIMVVLVTTSPIFPGKKHFLQALRKKHPEIYTIIQNINDRDTTMVLGKREIVLFGKGYIEDSLCSMRFLISAQSFYQVNPTQAEKLYQRAMEMAGLTGKEIVLDAYSGIGAIGLIASRKARKVIGVELNGAAVENAQKNAQLNKVTTATFRKGDAGRFMVAMAKEGLQVDVVFMNPPRSGSTHTFIKSVGVIKPQTVIYISCGPESLARDLVWLQEEGYEVQKMQPVDMFPWTEHIETCVGLRRRNQG